MKFSSILKTSLHSLRSNRSRSFLTILGIVIGITAVIMMVSIGNGAQNLILGQIASMGSNNVFAAPGSPSNKDSMQTALEQLQITTLKIKDLDDILKLPNVESGSALVFGTERMIYGNKSQKITYYGVNSSFFDIMGGQIANGRNFPNRNNQAMDKEIILGYKTKNDLFGDENPINKIVRIKKTNFRVVGVLQEKGSQMFMSLDEGVFMPAATAQKLLLGIDYVQRLVIKTIDKNRIDSVMSDVRLVLRQNHHIYNPEGDLSKDDFKVTSQKDVAGILGQVTSVFTLFLSSVAAIALLVGGIGIMNIMLVSVTERTKEIGLRKSVGARNKDILYQFLSEAVTLTVLGGIIGIFLGVTFSLLIGFILGKVLNVNWGFNISLPAIAIGFSVATIIGLVFGIYPAQKASKLDPIQALRYE